MENPSRLSDEQQRAPRPLADAPHGRTLAIMLAHGFPNTMLDKLVNDRLATIQPGITIAWVAISEVGLQGLADIDGEMAIVRAQSAVFESIKGVHFLMRDDNTRKTLACLITREALTERGSTHEPPLDPMQVFTAYRDEIERAANDCWERGEVDHGGIIRLTGAQFPRKPAEEPFR